MFHYLLLSLNYQILNVEVFDWDPRCEALNWPSWLVLELLKFCST